MQQHIRTIHSGIKDWEYEICFKDLTTRTSKVNHRRNVQGGIKEFISENVISEKSSLRNHIEAKIQGIKDAQCPLCDKSYTLTAHLKTYIKSPNELFDM